MSSLPPDDLDERLELASAYLDGEATPAEVARVEADPALRALVDELRGIAGLVGSPPAVDAKARDRIVAAAARELGVTSLADARPRRRAAPVLSAAAAVLLLLLVGTALVLRTDRDDDSSQTAAQLDEAKLPSTTAAAGGAEDSAAGSGSGAGAPSAATAYARLSAGNLGEFDDVGVLASTAQDLFTASLAGGGGATAATAGPPNDIVSGCEATLVATDGEVGGARYDAFATVDNASVAVVVFDLVGGDGLLFRLYVVDSECEVLTRDDF